MKAGEALPAKLFHLLDLLLGSAARGSVGTGRAVLQASQALLLKTPDPLGGGTGADFELGGRRVQSPLINQNTLSELHSTNKGKSCILMDVHSGLPV